MADFSPGTRNLIERFTQRDHQYVGEAGRTKILHHGEVRPKAIVLFHGLSASPTQFERFASELFGRGYNVLVPRLPRHGHSDRLSGALEKLNVEELRQFTSDSIELAQGLGERVIVAGFSLGGLLTTWSAQHFEIERAVAIAPFLGIAAVPNRFLPRVRSALKALPNLFPWWDPIAREKQMPEHGYPRYATHALAEALALANEVFERADRALSAKRLILVTNAREAAVNNRAIENLEARLRRVAESALDHVRLKNLPISHDIIEPLRHPEVADRVFPDIMKLIEGDE